MRVYGTCDGAEIAFSRVEGRWEATVPAAPGGEYVTALYAQDEAGNTAYMATVLFAVNPETLCLSVKLLEISGAAELSLVSALTTLRGVTAAADAGRVEATAQMRTIGAAVIRCALCGR